MNPRSLFYVEKWPGVDFRWGSLFVVTPASNAVFLNLIICKQHRFLEYRGMHFRRTLYDFRLYSIKLSCLIKVKQIDYAYKTLVLIVVALLKHMRIHCFIYLLLLTTSLFFFFGYFCGCRGFCHRTESDPFLFLLPFVESYIAALFLNLDKISLLSFYSCIK